ncbi:hypothetical protein Dvar_26950 [Desulfosarcina variabilis str. Montpellier]
MAAQCAQAIVHDTCTSENKSLVDAVITKALGVIQEDGVYAGALFLCSRSSKDKDIAQKVMQAILDLVEKLSSAMKFGWVVEPSIKQEPEKIFKFLTDNVTCDLERLLIVRETLERMMVYARYGVKAKN